MSNRRTRGPWALIVGVLMLLATVAVADDTLTRDFRFPGGGSLVIDVDSGHVVVRTGSSDGVSITVTAERGDIEDFVDLRFEETGDGLEVIGREPARGRRKSGWFGGDDGDLRFEIVGPRDMDLDVKSGGGHVSIDDVRGQVNVKTGGGHVEIGDVEGPLQVNTGGGHVQVGRVDGTLDVSTGGGHIQVEDIRGDVNASSGGGHITLGDIDGDLEAQTGGGHIRADHVGGRAKLGSGGGNVFLDGADDDAEIRTGGGNVGLRKVSGHVLVRTGGGDIEVELMDGSGGADLETDDGDIDLIVPGGAGFDIEAYARDGEVEAPSSVRGGRDGGERLRTSIGRGGSLVKLYTHDGDIRISEGR